MSLDAFGPNLRRLRLQRGITLEQIADTTKISADLLADLERNDFSRWPAGIYARAYIRQYAYALGVDPDASVDEFCRWFPQGDRRAEALVRGHAEIVGHDLAWEDEAAATLPEGDRRGMLDRPTQSTRSMPHSPLTSLFGRLRRAFGRA